jgi:putative FmdB family regulatory protein
MPLYEYKCSKCGHLYEVLASSSSEKSSPCPKCGAGQAVKQFSAFAVTSGSAGTAPACEPGGSPAGCGSCGGGGGCPYGGGFDDL